MVDKLRKALAVMPPKQRDRVNAVLKRLWRGDLEGLDIKSLKGHKDTFRVRSGNYRVIFLQYKDEKPQILFIGRRSEKTYKDY